MTIRQIKDIEPGDEIVIDGITYLVVGTSIHHATNKVELSYVPVESYQECYFDGSEGIETTRYGDKT